MFKKVTSTCIIAGLFISGAVFAQAATPNSAPVVKAAHDHGHHEKSAKKADVQVNINTADEKALENLPHVGQAMAKRIVDYRTQHGAFKSVDDLKNVKGISAKKLEAMKKQAVV